MSVLIAIDPGAAGSVCILRDGELSVHKAGATPRDTCEILERAQRDSYGASFDGSAPGPLIRCYMEKVGGYVGGGGQPGSAMFTFGCGYGVYIGILTALHIPFELVSPQSWIKGLSLGSKGLVKPELAAGMTQEQRKTELRRTSSINSKLKTQWKTRLKDVAQRLYPGVKVTLQLADSLLILEWARRRENAPMARMPEAQKEMVL